MSCTKGISREIRIIIGARWYNMWIPLHVPFLIDGEAEARGWCENCPLSAHNHPICETVVYGGRKRNKLCTRPFIKFGLLPLREYMQTGGCGAQTDDYVRAKRLYRKSKPRQFDLGMEAS